MLLVVAAQTAIGAEPAARVTTAVGAVSTDSGRALGVRSSLADEEKISLEKDEGCSVLIDDDALVEMCEETEMVLETDPESGRRLVRIGASEIRIIVEPRAVGQRIEVHTPAAIATILGTIVHFAVDLARVRPSSRRRKTVCAFEAATRVSRARPSCRLSSRFA
jgi:hypothetical protein